MNSLRNKIVIGSLVTLAALGGADKWGPSCVDYMDNKTTKIRLNKEKKKRDEKKTIERKKLFHSYFIKAFDRDCNGEIHGLDSIRGLAKVTDDGIIKITEKFANNNFPLFFYQEGKGDSMRIYYKGDRYLIRTSFATAKEIGENYPNNCNLEVKLK